MSRGAFEGSYIFKPKPKCEHTFKLKQLDDKFVNQCIHCDKNMCMCGKYPRCQGDKYKR